MYSIIMKKDTQTMKILQCISDLGIGVNTSSLDIIIEKTGFPRPTIRGRIHLLKKLGFVIGGSKSVLITELGKKQLVRKQKLKSEIMTGLKSKIITGEQLIKSMRASNG